MRASATTKADGTITLSAITTASDIMTVSGAMSASSTKVESGTKTATLRTNTANGANAEGSGANPARGDGIVLPDKNFASGGE